MQGRVGGADDRDAAQLRRHLREAHPNLLGDPTSWVAYAPLPQSGLSAVPPEWLHAIHEANHAGLYRQHQSDEYLPPKRYRVTQHDLDLLIDRYTAELAAEDDSPMIAVHGKNDLSSTQIDDLVNGVEVTITHDGHTVLLIPA